MIHAMAITLNPLVIPRSSPTFAAAILITQFATFELGSVSSLWLYPPASLFFSSTFLIATVSGFSFSLPHICEKDLLVTPI